MDVLDTAAAAQFQEIRDKFKDGPFYTGTIGGKGFVTYETERPSQDHVKRYTDRYLRHRRIGNTIAEFPFATEMYPEELKRALGVSKQPPKITNVDPEHRTIEDVESAVRRAQEEENKDPDEEDAASNHEEEPEDDFEEEMEDDDYNAEKYFDDGDDYGGDDDDGGEAAY